MIQKDSGLGLKVLAAGMVLGGFLLGAPDPVLSQG